MLRFPGCTAEGVAVVIEALSCDAVNQTIMAQELERWKYRSS
jgi:hypothetical protein